MKISWKMLDTERVLLSLDVGDDVFLVEVDVDGLLTITKGLLTKNTFFYSNGVDVILFRKKTGYFQFMARFGMYQQKRLYQKLSKQEFEALYKEWLTLVINVLKNFGGECKWKK